MFLFMLLMLLLLVKMNQMLNDVVVSQFNYILTLNSSELEPDIQALKNARMRGMRRR